MEPLLVQWSTCAKFALTTFDPNNGTYWGERAELYRHQYLLSRWSWFHGVRKIEFWCDACALVVSGRVRARTVSSDSCGRRSVTLR